LHFQGGGADEIHPINVRGGNYANLKLHGAIEEKAPNGSDEILGEGQHDMARIHGADESSRRRVDDLKYYNRKKDASRPANGAV
jgi:hypothetical protein